MGVQLIISVIKFVELSPSDLSLKSTQKQVNPMVEGANAAAEQVSHPLSSSQQKTKISGLCTGYFLLLFECYKDNFAPFY